MAVDINFINLDDNDVALGPEIDLGIENSVLLDLQFDITEPKDHTGFIYRNDTKIGEFGKTSARGKYLEWYAGTGVPIYVKNGDTFKAVVQVADVDLESAQPGDWYLEDDEWYYCTVDEVELKDICSPFLDDTNPNQIRTVNRNGQSHDIPLNNIDTRYVTNMGEMFREATNFNQNISNWDVSKVTDMSYMFNRTTNFNQNISNWDVSKVTNMLYMFREATNFNQNISNWDVSNVTNMGSMFNRTSNFNQNISNWDVSKVTNMSSMFYNATNFNQNISNWDVGNVTNISSMFFGATNFNQNIANWDVGNVTNMHYMFHDATSFNQNLSKWCVTNITSKPISFDTGSKLTTASLPVWGTCPNG